MSYIDIALCIPVVWGLYKGFTKGLIVQLTSLVALGLGIYGSITFSGFVAEYLKINFEIGYNYVSIIAFAITFFIIVVGIHFLGKAIEKLLKLVALGFFNKLFGALFGGLKMILILSVVIFLIEMVNNSIHVISEETKAKSMLYEPLSKAIPRGIPQAKTLIKERTEKILN